MSRPEPPVSPGRVRRWLRHPMMLLLVKTLLVVTPVVLSAVLAAQLHWPPGIRKFLIDPIVIVLVAALFAYYTRAVEGRPATELAPRGALKQVIAGFALGTTAFAVVIGTLAALGMYRVSGLSHWSILAAPLAGALVTGVFEELLFRGILFRIAEDSLGSYWALAISSLFFGAAHLFNPNATLLAGVAIMVEAGIFLSAAYMLTRRLWLPIGIHAGWNFTQGGVFSVAVSGFQSHGLLQGTLTGPVLLTGGDFGAESSLPAILFCGALGIAMFIWARRLGQIVAPYWHRTPEAATPAS